MIKVYHDLTQDQRKRGVIFTSTLSSHKVEVMGDLTHEVMANDDDKDKVIARLKDDKFFNASPWRYNIIRQ
jgi:hypothetical protein